jgi:hypothetical protein
MTGSGVIQKEDTLKAHIFADFFGQARFLYRPSIDNIDFVVMDHTGRHVLWAEAKRSPTPLVDMFVQLILTIGKARTFDTELPPPFLGVFDNEKMAFIPYAVLNDIFYQNDFNWKVTPSNRGTKEFAQIQRLVEDTVNKEKLVFDMRREKALLTDFIKHNLVSSAIMSPDMIVRTQIDKTNFMHVFRQWSETVAPAININWDIAKRRDILMADFYLADLLSEDNRTIKDQLYVLLQSDKYELDRQIDDAGLFSIKTVAFKDDGKAHQEFWGRYVRPPKEVYWDYIVERRDLLVPQDVREQKGAFFTPPQWVAKAHEYLANIFGENWQDEYYVWDNSAGSGNLLAGLVNRDRVWASTLDRADVQVMHDRIENGANLWHANVFQFDFLNDDIKAARDGGKIPDKLFDLINDDAQRQKIIFLINPPYGEAGNARTRAQKGTRPNAKEEAQHKAGVSDTKTKERFNDTLGKALNEKYIQFFVRILNDIPDCKMGAFVKPKYICGGSMRTFRRHWKAEYLGGFATPATTHDNCTGEYPICFFVWDLAVKKDFPRRVPCEVFNVKGKDTNLEVIREGRKVFYASEKKTINDWLRNYRYGKDDSIGIARCDGPDAQRNKYCWIAQTSIHTHKLHLNKKNLVPFCVYFAVRHCIEHRWINDSDQYFFPNKAWEHDTAFQNDCLVFTLFNSYNKIKVREGVNHWIPFREEEVGSATQFQSRFMSGFLKERGIGNREQGTEKEVSPEALAALDAGRELWRYYHARVRALRATLQRDAPADAAFYDIREYFQGSQDGKMNAASGDETYNGLIKTLREACGALARKIEPRVYEYGFLKK